MLKIFAVTLVILHVGQSHILESTGRFRRDADQPTEGSPLIVKIKESLAHLRHAEVRLKTFVEKVEEGLKNSTIVKAIHAAHGKSEKGEVELDLTRIVSDSDITTHNEHAPKNFRDLIKRISEDTHILLDQLHLHLDKLGGHIQEDSFEDSAEGHHEESKHN